MNDSSEKDKEPPPPPPPPAPGGEETGASSSSVSKKRGRSEGKEEKEDETEEKRGSINKKKSDYEGKTVIVILGSSFGGLGAALRLLERQQQQQQQQPDQALPSALQIVLVDPKPYFTIGGTWQFAWTNRAASVQTWNLTNAPCIKDGKVKLVPKAATRIDAEASTVELDDGTILSFNHLIIATGIHGDPSSVPGMDSLLDVHNLNHVDRQRQELMDLVEKAKQRSSEIASSSISDKKKNDKLVFVVVTSEKRYKCPLGPFEQVFLVDQVLRDAHVRDAVDIAITYCDEWPMPLSTRESFVKELNSRDIQFHPYYQITSIDAGRKECHYENGKCIQFDMAWTLYPAKASDFLLPLCNNHSGMGLIPVDPFTNRILVSSVQQETSGDSATQQQQQQHKNLYAVGDVCLVNTGARDLQPKAGEFAWQMGRRAADCIFASFCDKKQGDGVDTTTIVEPRKGGCFAEAGWTKNLQVNSDFSQVVTGESIDPIVWVEEVTDDPNVKTDWVNQYIVQIFGPDALLFQGEKKGDGTK